MKTLFSVILITLSTTLSFAQVDTVDNGKAIYIDSSKNLKMEIPFKKRMVTGTVKGFDLTTTSLVVEGASKNSQKQGVWNYYEYDSLGNKLVVQFYTYENDSLNGPFQERKDSLKIIGSYAKNELDGAFKELVLSLDDSGNTIETPVDSGQFKNGIQYGHWTYLNNGFLSKVGNYENGKMHLHWKIYDTLNRTPQKLMKDIQYFEGEKTGTEVIYYKYENGKLINEKESIPWQMGKLSGNYSRKDSNGIALESGMYSDDIKIGKWVYKDPASNTTESFTYLNNQLNGPYHLDIGSVPVVKGTYALGKKNKTWSYFSETGQLQREEKFDNDVKSGEWNFYNSKKILYFSMVYEENKVVEMYRFDKTGNEILKLQFDYSPENYIKITAEEYGIDSSISVDLMYKPNGDSLDENGFLDIYLKSSKDTSIFKLHGGFSVTKSGTVEYQGVYATNVKDGNWSYYYNSRIIWRKVYKTGIMNEELFLDKSTGAKIEKGEYVLWFGPERPQLEFKIQEGVRHGKSIWYKKNGEEMKVEKYKNGFLN